MKRTFPLIVVLLLAIGCQSEEVKMHDTWIGKYSANRPDEDAFTEKQKAIIQFKEDSLHINLFLFERQKQKNSLLSARYQMIEDSLILTTPRMVSKFLYTMSPDSFTMESINPEPQKYIYQKLPRYQLAKREVEFIQLLQSTSFEVLDSIQIAFKDQGKLVEQNSNNSTNQDKFWKLDQFEDELFLVGNGPFGHFLHVNQILPEGFSATLYGKKNQEISFIKLPAETKRE